MSNQPVPPGLRWTQALEAERPLVVPGAINAAFALVARQAGCRALYLSGSGVATSAFGLPDLGMTSLTEVVEEARRITNVVPDVPLLVDADTGFGGELSIERSVMSFIAANVAAIHLEDQEGQKRCGHRPNKKIVGKDEMVARIRAASEGRKRAGEIHACAPYFQIMARTDAFAQEGLEATIARCRAYIAAGADALFPEAITKLEDFAAIAKAVAPTPILANITEFGKTPLFTTKELGDAGVRIALFPLTIFRHAMGAARHAYSTLKNDGTQQGLVDAMMTREEVYTLIDYHSYEKRQDASAL